MPCVTRQVVAALAASAALAALPCMAAQPLPHPGGDGLPDRLTPAAADAERGRAIVTNRQQGLCLLCHSGPFAEERFQGNLAPSLQGAGSRWTAAQLRLRLADASKLNPDTIMPSYYRTEGLNRVLPAVQGKPLLGEREIEDVVAFLLTLKD